jgi:hypothetical protein
MRNPIPDDQPITLTWTTTTVTAYQRTFTYAQLRDAVNAVRARYGHPTSPHIGDDLHLLDENWLDDFETDGEVEDLNREIDAPDFALEDLPVFTVTIESPDGGEKPTTYVLPADSLDAARRLALAWHSTANELHSADAETGAPDVRVVEGPWDTFRGEPIWPADLPGRAWNDLRTDPAFLALAYAATHTCD